MKRRLPRILLALFLGLCMVEGALWVLHWTMGAEQRTTGAGAELLCIGDSHTYGWNVDAPAAWPARVEQLAGLRVANRAAPGKNTATLLEELDEYLALDQPQAVLILAGLNNPWSRPHQTPGAHPLAWSRTARLLAILAGRFEDEPVRRTDLAALPEDERPDEGAFVEVEAEDGQTEVRVLTREGDYESFTVGGGSISQDEAQLAFDWIERDLVELCERVRAAGATPVLLTYALEEGGHLPDVNFVIREAAVVADAPLVDVHAALAPRLEEFGRDRLFFHDAHPRREGYAVIARVVHDALLAEGLVEGPAVGDPWADLAPEQLEPSLVAAPDGAGGWVLELAYEPGLAWSVVLAREATDAEGFDWLGLELPLVGGALLEASGRHADLGGGFDADGRAQLALDAALLAELGAGEGALRASLVVRTRDWGGIAVGPAVALR